MSALSIYADPDIMPATESGRIGYLLGLKKADGVCDNSQARQVEKGLKIESATRLINILGQSGASGALLIATTLCRARKSGGTLSREVSGRLYSVSIVVDAVSRMYRGDTDTIVQFLNEPHPLLENSTPLEMAQMNSAGASAVLKMLRRAAAGFPI